MTPYYLAHADLFRTIADILVRDYIAPSETAETVAEWCETVDSHAWTKIKRWRPVTTKSVQELAALIADVEGYEKR